MSYIRRNIVAYGLSEPEPIIPQAPIISLRAPTSADKVKLGTLWIQPKDTTGTAVNAAWILTSIINNLATWIAVEVSGGIGTFSSLVVTPGPIALTGLFTLTAGTNAVSIGADAADHAVTIGSLTGSSAMLLQNGSGGFVIDGVGSSIYAIGPSTTTGLILIGGTSQTGTITLGNSTGIQTVGIALGNGGSKTVNMATGTVGNTVNINTGINTVANVTNINSGASAAASTVNILSGTATAGTQTLNLATGAFAHTINVGTGAAVVNTIAIGGTGANVVTIADTQTGGSVSIGAAMTTGTINIGSATSGLVTMPPVVVTAAGTTVVNNVRVGQAVYTGNVTGAAATVVLTLTNALISATSSLMVSVANGGGNDAQMSIQRVLPGAGTCAITLKNNGAAALNGNIAVDFWVRN